MSLKKFAKPTLFLSLILLLLYAYVIRDFEKAPPTLFVNGEIFTLDEGQPQIEAFYVEDGVIRDIGTEQELRTILDSSINTVDLHGKTVLPGFIDVHTHFMLSVFFDGMHDLSGFSHDSSEKVWDHFEQVVRETKTGEWIICKGIDPVFIPDLQMPNKRLLDHLAPDNPVFILSQSMHSFWANSLAFAAAGINKNTPNPSESSYYKRDENGELTGLIAEQVASVPFMPLIKKELLTTKKVATSAAKIMKEYAGNGNTTIVSTGLTIDDKTPLLLLKHLSSKKADFFPNLLSKVGVLPERNANPRHLIYMRHDRSHLLPAERIEDDFYNIIGIKHWYDGSPYIGSMYLNEPYSQSHLTNEELHIPNDHRGEPLITRHSLDSFIRKNQELGWQIAIHTQGDAAITEVLDAYEAVSQDVDVRPYRHRLEHCLLLPNHEYDRMSEMNISPSFHINHLYYYGDALYEDLLGAERTERILPLGSALSEGLRLTLHADQPMFESNPFSLMRTAVERQTKSGRKIATKESIALKDAIKALTIDAAWQIHMEDKIGSIETGKYADFIVLDQNLFEVPIEELDQLRPIIVYINGNEVEMK